MSERDQYQFAEAFEEKTGWDAEDYPSRDVVNLCFSMWQASREALKAEQVATAHRLVNKRSGQVHPWVYTEGKIDASEGDIFRVEVMPLYTSPPSQPHPIDTTSQQYETLAKGDTK